MPHHAPTRDMSQHVGVIKSAMYKETSPPPHSCPWWAPRLTHGGRHQESRRVPQVGAAGYPPGMELPMRQLTHVQLGSGAAAQSWKVPSFGFSGSGLAPKGTPLCSMPLAARAAEIFLRRGAEEMVVGIAAACTTADEWHRSAQPGWQACQAEVLLRSHELQAH